MKETLVQARVGVSDLRDGVNAARAKLAHERTELATCTRRKQLAMQIGDAETVAVAERFERHHEERCAVLAKKCEAQEAELALVEREVAEMTVELKYAMSGAVPPSGPGPAGSTAPAAPAAADAATIDAELKLAELKRRMGK
jgi:hypothetical protein